jgi:hypothetical protein
MFFFVPVAVHTCLHNQSPREPPRTHKLRPGKNSSNWSFKGGRKEKDDDGGREVKIINKKKHLPLFGHHLQNFFPFY